MDLEMPAEVGVPAAVFGGLAEGAVRRANLFQRIKFFETDIIRYDDLSKSV